MGLLLRTLDNRLLRTAGGVLLYANPKTPNSLTLTFDNIANVPVEDVTSMSDWLIYFDWLQEDERFTSIIVNGNDVVFVGANFHFFVPDSMPHIIAIKGVHALKNIIYFSLYGFTDIISIDEIIPNNSIADYTQSVEFFNCPFLTTIQNDFSNFTKIWIFTLINCPISFLPILPTSGELRYLSLSGMPLLTEIPGESVLNSLQYLDLSYNDSYTINEIDSILEYYSVYHENISIVYLRQNTPIPPNLSILLTAQLANPQCEFDVDI